MPKVTEDLEELMTEGENFLVAKGIKDYEAHMYEICNRQTLQDRLIKYFARSEISMSVVRIRRKSPYFILLSNRVLKKMYIEGNGKHTNK